MRSDSVKNMSAYADQNHAPSLTDVRLEFSVFILPSDWCKSYSFRRKCNIMKKSKQKRNLPVIQDNNLFCWRYCLGDIPLMLRNALEK